MNSMTPLLILLFFKIAVTLLFVAGPFLLYPKAKIDGILQISGDSLGLYRLYGMAILALLVGYSGAAYQALDGRFPAEILVMGVVSNAGAALVMVKTRMARTNPALCAVFALIAVGLVAMLLAPGFAMAPIGGE